jgi:hypothetical protein
MWRFLALILHVPPQAIVSHRTIVPMRGPLHRNFGAKITVSRLRHTVIRQVGDVPVLWTVFYWLGTPLMRRRARLEGPSFGLFSWHLHGVRVTNIYALLDAHLAGLLTSIAHRQTPDSTLVSLENRSDFHCVF